MCVTAFVCMRACFSLKPIRIRQCVSCLFLNELTYEMTFDREKAPRGFVVLTGPKDIYICVYVHCAPLQLLMNEISICVNIHNNTRLDFLILPVKHTTLPRRGERLRHSNQI